jgi:hypothetical protein
MGAPDVAQWIDANPRITDVLVGAVLPTIILTVAHCLRRAPQPQWQVVQQRMASYRPEEPDAGGSVDHAPARVLAFSLAGSALLTFCLLPFNAQHAGLLAAFGAVMLLVSLIAFLSEKLGRTPV